MESLIVILLMSSAVVLGENVDACNKRISLPYDNVLQLAVANNYFAFNLYRELTVDSHQNVIFSPFSAASAFGALYFGAKAETAEELKKALGYAEAKLNDESVHGSYFYYISQTIPQFNTDGNEVSTACALLVNRNVPLLTQYKLDIEHLYQALVEELDFSDHWIIQEVNNWVKEETRGKIESIVTTVDTSTAFVLLTAAYFKGSWNIKFDSKNTRPKPFYNGGVESAKKEVPTMHLTAIMRYTDSSFTNFQYDYQAVELPYRGKHINMLILLPANNTVMDEFQKGLTYQNFTALRRMMYKTKVNLALPKFKVSYSRELSENMKNLGLTGVFKPSPNFSAMTTGNIFLSEVSHKAFIDVNEEGSEAAALTSIITTRMMPVTEDVPNVFVDRPFIFAVVDHLSNMILFLGRVNNL